MRRPRLRAFAYKAHPRSRRSRRASSQSIKRARTRHLRVLGARACAQVFLRSVPGPHLACVMMMPASCRHHGMFEARLVQGGLLKKVVDAVKDLVNETNLVGALYFAAFADACLSFPRPSTLL